MIATYQWIFLTSTCLAFYVSFPCRLSNNKFIMNNLKRSILRGQSLTDSWSIARGLGKVKLCIRADSATAFRSVRKSSPCRTHFADSLLPAGRSTESNQLVLSGLPVIVTGRPGRFGSRSGQTTARPRRDRPRSRSIWFVPDSDDLSPRVRPSPHDPISFDPVVRPTGKAPVPDGGRDGDAVSVVGHRPRCRADRRDDFLAAAAGAAVDHRAIPKAHIEHALLENLGNVLDEPVPEDHDTPTGSLRRLLTRWLPAKV